MNEGARRKSVAREVELPGLRGEGGHPFLVSAAIGALSRLTDPAPVEVEPEAEVLSRERRRELVAPGVEIHGPGR